MKKKYKFIIIIILVLICVSYTYLHDNISSKETNFTEFSSKVANTDNIKYFMRDELSVAYGLVDKEGYTIDDRIFYLNKDDVFDAFINIGNFVDVGREYKIITFLNYKKTDFYVDDIKYHDFDVYIEKQQDLQIPIKVRNFESGYNDVIFAIVKYPNADLNDEQRCESEMSHMLFIRLTIVNGEYNEIPDFTDIKSFPNAMIDIMLHPEEAELKQFPSTTIAADTDATVYCTVGNTRKDVHSYAIILLDNWNQRVIADNNSIFFVNLPSLEQICLPITLNFNKRGIHNITAILIEDPYVLKQEHNMDVTQSIRLKVNVE